MIKEYWCPAEPVDIAKVNGITGTRPGLVGTGKMSLVCCHVNRDKVELSSTERGFCEELDVEAHVVSYCLRIATHMLLAT